MREIGGRRRPIWIGGCGAGGWARGLGLGFGLLGAARRGRAPRAADLEGGGASGVGSGAGLG